MRPSLNFIHPFIYPTLSSADGRTRVLQAALRVERGKGEKYSCLPSSVPLSARLFTSLAPVYYNWKIKAGIWRQEHLNVWNRSCSNSQKWTVFWHEVLQTDKICYYRDSFDRSTASLNKSRTVCRCLQWYPDTVPNFIYLIFNNNSICIGIIQPLLALRDRWLRLQPPALFLVTVGSQSESGTNRFCCKILLCWKMVWIQDRK